MVHLFSTRQFINRFLLLVNMRTSSILNWIRAFFFFIEWIRGSLLKKFGDPSIEISLLVCAIFLLPIKFQSFPVAFRIKYHLCS